MAGRGGAAAGSPEVVFTLNPTDTLEDNTSVLLVLGIARLGEASLRGWWQSHGLSPAGRYVLGGAFPRTWPCAALELDVLSAAWRHDEVLGRHTALHLFSDQLPFRRWAMAWLAERKTAGDRSLVARLEAWDLERARHDLRDWVGDAAPVGEAVATGLRLGQVEAGQLQDAGALDGIVRGLASAYVDQGSDFRPPYLDLAS